MTKRDKKSKIKLGTLDIDVGRYNRAKSIGDDWFAGLKKTLIEIISVEYAIASAKQEIENILKYENAWNELKKSKQTKRKE